VAKNQGWNVRRNLRDNELIDYSPYSSLALLRLFGIAASTYYINVVADALSRHDSDNLPICHAISAPFHSGFTMGTDKSLPVRMRLDMKAFRRHSTCSGLTSTSPAITHWFVLMLTPYLSAGLLQPLEVPSMMWSDIAMDFVEGLLWINRKSVILSLVDRFSLFVHFIAIGHPYTATIAMRIFFGEIVLFHGIPSSIVSDPNPNLVFTNNF
jgi:hypothetical protein